MDNKDNRPKWLKNKPEKRDRSVKQEKRMAKDLSGFATINSGATFSQNDVETAAFSIECKTTEKKSYVLKVEEIKKMEVRCPSNKVPLFVIEFEKHGKELAVISMEDLKHLVKF